MTRNIIFLVLPFFLLMILPPPCFAAASGTDRIVTETLDSLANSVGIISLETNTVREAGPRRLKVALFDNGTVGFQAALGVTLPRSTVLHANPIPYPPNYVEDGHGTKMAEVFSNLLDRTGAKYDLHVFRAYGYSNLKAAVETAIREKFDLVLYPQVWEYGGNDDGKGFINALVSQATAKGITWVNATGNFAQNLYRTKVEPSVGTWAKLATRSQSVRIRCVKNEENENGKCRLRLVLAWNSFSDDINKGTDKDLDLFLMDGASKQIASGEKVQVLAPTPGKTNESTFPREVIEDVEIKPGVYHVRVKIKSANFSSDVDKLRITASGDFIDMLDRTEGETLMAPADNPSVIAIGAADTKKSSFNRSQFQPDRALSLIETEDGGSFKGSSQASAAYAARIALELTHRSDLYRDAILQIVRGGEPRITKKPAADKVVVAPPAAPRPAPPAPAPAPAPEVKVSTRDLVPVHPTKSSCFEFAVLTVPGRNIWKMLGEGVVVDTTTGVKVFINEDPFVRAERLGITVSGQTGDDRSQIFVGDMTGFYATSRANRKSLPRDAVEFVQAPSNASYCPMR